MKSVRTVALGVLTAFLPALLGSAATTAFARESDVHPKTAQGVKIKHPGGDGDVRQGNCKYQTGTDTRSYASVIENLDLRGIRHLFIKYPEPGKQVDDSACDHPQIHNEILKILGAMKEFNVSNGRTADNSMRAWVWKRKWFWRTDQGGELTGNFNEFIDRMSAVINKARAQNVRRPLEGIAPIETNLPGSQRIREFAVRVAEEINAHTNGWLKNHTLLFPGAGNGSWFKNINGSAGPSPGTQFFLDIKSQVKYFAFIYKFMKSHDGGVNTNLEPHYYPDWKNKIRDEQNQDFATQKSYIEDELGFGDLRDFINLGRNDGRVWVANVVFWGDSADGMTQMRRTNVQLMHQLLVEDQQMDQPGYFFDFAINDPAAPKESDKDLAKHVLLDNDPIVTRNTRNAWEERGTGDTMTVWEEWFNWRLNLAGY